MAMVNCYAIRRNSSIGSTILSQHPDLLPRRAPTLITPHAGELSRLLGTDAAAIEARRLEHARQAAERLGLTVLLCRPASDLA